MKDLVNEGLRLVLSRSSAGSIGSPRLMTEAPVRVSEGNDLPVLSNQEMAELLEQAGEWLP